MSRFSLTEVQARAILDLRLQRLTQLEGTTIRNEHEQLQSEIAGLRAILGDESRVMAVIREEVLALRERFADERRSEIIPGEGEIDLEDLIAEEEMVVSISRGGYIKRLPVSTYRAQRRGGKGLRGARLKDDDYIEHLFIASTHAYLLFFTNRGRVYRQKVYELPQGARDARGRHISNVLALVDGEEVRAVFATRDYNEAKYLVLATRDGMVKKTELKAYDTVLREAGLFAINLTDDDELVGVQMTDGDDDILIVSARGQAARFAEAAVRPMGRQTRGVKAMNLDARDRVLALCVARDDEDLLVVTGNGFGKRTPMSDYPRKGRPTKGVRTIKVTDRKGELVTARPVREGHQLLLVSLGGQVIRIDVGSVRRTGRSTEGVRLMVMSDDDQIATVAAVLDHDDDDADAPDEVTEPSLDAPDADADPAAELD
jgi:DNA gyrase subunit A